MARHKEGRRKGWRPVGVVIVSILGLLAASMARGASDSPMSPNAAPPPPGFVFVRWPGGVVELVPEHLSPALPSVRNENTKGSPCPAGTVRHCYESPPNSWNVICECKRLGITKKGPPKAQAVKGRPCTKADGTPGITGNCDPYGNCRCIDRPIRAPGPGINTKSGSCCPACATALKRVQ